MIDRLSLGALSPARRADVIFEHARAELNQRLWQAALGTGETRADSATGALPQRGMLDALLQELYPSATAPATNANADTAAASAAETRAARDPAAADARAVAEALVAAPVAHDLGANARHAATLNAAAQRTGIPASALAAIVDAESAKTANGSWNPLSRNPRSSAAGLGQFLSRTWEHLATTPGTWLNQAARDSGWLDSAGRVAHGSRPALLALRYDSVAAINGVADFARRNLDGLKHAGVAVGGDVVSTARLAYLGHHLGLGDAVRFLRDGALGDRRARVLLDAQVGGAASRNRIAAAGNAADAHRTWLLGYLDRAVRPGRFAGGGSQTQNV